MKVMVIGGGGREHAVAMKLKENRRIDTLYCVPGNGGTAAIAENIDIKANDVDGIVSFAVKNGVDFVFIAPEEPLCLGLADKLRAAGIKTFGPSAAAARIEGSKAFAKDLMKKYGIPTARYEVFTDISAAEPFIRSFPVPPVIKADGLAAGKGVIVAETHDEAVAAARDMLSGVSFGKSGASIVVEERLTGPEVSVLAFTDGTAVKPMVSAQDHKRALDGDEGPNTGGMGAISPSLHYTEDVACETEEKIIFPTIKAMAAEGCPFEGVLYFGLMLTADGPKVIEFNCRFGDPETQVVLPRLRTDLLDIAEAVAEHRLSDIGIEWSDKAAAGVVLASGGYPGKYATGYEISGLDETSGTVYHAGTALRGGKYYTAGGRVLCVEAMGDTVPEAIDNAYKAVSAISFKDMHFRHDIGRK